MNSFFKTFFACFLAIIASSIFSFFAFFVIISMLSALLAPSAPSYQSGSVLTINLTETIVDKEPVNPIELVDMGSFTFQKTLSITKILGAIESAAVDPKIEGIYLNLSSANSIGIANVTEIRDALKKFKESGKFIVSYSDVYSHSTYFMSSVADKIFLAPEGAMQWSGLSAQTMFFKGTLEKLGIVPEIIRHGKYKSAVEPFTQDKMSDENREQTSALLNSVWGYMIGEVAAARSIDSALLQQYASDLSVVSSEDAVKLSLVDSLGYPAVASEWINAKTGNSDFKSVSLYDYVHNNFESSSEYSKNKIALIFADGEIVSSASENRGEISSTVLCRNLKSVREDETVKAVVLRINSPGGSALASDMIWNEVKLLRDKKPVVVSMGNVAASGGYYIAAPADIIIAEPTTITGSIGVFGVLFNAEKGLKEKLGVTIDVVNTNRSADMGSIARPLTDTERLFIQKGVERTYDTFVTKVAAGRNLTFDKVNQIAGGRVWSGADAVENGLVDGFGGVKEAVSLAADRAGVADSFRISVVGADQNSFTQIMSSMMEEVRVSFASSGVEQNISGQYDRVKRYMKGDKIMSVMPYTLTIE
ncbi:MAG: signal peptide peptidase SppA [Rikenellaceae bacterium]